MKKKINVSLYFLVKSVTVYDGFMQYASNQSKSHLLQFIRDGPLVKQIIGFDCDIWTPKLADNYGPSFVGSLRPYFFIPSYFPQIKY